MAMRGGHSVSWTPGYASACSIHTQVMTTPATTQDSIMGSAIHQDLAGRDLLPGTHVLDNGYVDADLLVTADTPHQTDVIGPPFGAYSRQCREGQVCDLRALVIEGEAQQARCPPGRGTPPGVASPPVPTTICA
jgi:transposase